MYFRDEAARRRQEQVRACAAAKRCPAAGDPALREEPSQVKAAVPLTPGSREEHSRVAARACGCAIALAFVLAALVPARAAAIDAKPVVAHAEDLLEWGRWKEARAALEQAIAQDDHNASLLAYYAHVLNGFGDYNGATAAARKAIGIDGQCAVCHLFLSEALGEHAKHMGKVHALIELRTIRKELERARQLGPSLNEVYWGVITFNLEVPPAVGGKPADALATADLLARSDPVDGHIARATVYLALGQDARAMAEYRAAVRDYPNDPRGNFNLGLALFQHRQFAAALPYLEKAQRLQPASPLHSGYYAAALIHLNRQNDARRVVESAQAQFPQSRLPNFLVAKALKDIGQNFAWAKQLVQSYLSVPPEPDQPTADDARHLLGSLG